MGHKSNFNLKHSPNAALMLAKCLLFYALLGFVVLPVHAQLGLESDRIQFKSALLALDAGEQQEFLRLKAELANYPLAMYLQKQWLSGQIKAKQDVDNSVQEYLQTHPNHYLAAQLRRDWLKSLARKKLWRLVLVTAKPEHGDWSRCLIFRARIAMGQLKKFDKDSTAAWLRGDDFSTDCAKVFNYLESKGSPPVSVIWERIYLAMSKNQPVLALRLARWLNAGDQAWVKFWVAVHRDPARYLKDKRLASDGMLQRRIVVSGLKRFARKDAQQAYPLWKKLQRKYSFNQQNKAEVERYLISRAIRDDVTEVGAWAQAMPKQYKTQRTYEAIARWFLLRQDWPALETAISKMPADLRSEDVWQYWLARAATERGELGLAQGLLNGLADETSYYGFLAADRLASAYHIQNQPVSVIEDDKNSLRINPAMLRIREYRALDYGIESWREWRDLLPQLSKQKIQAAARLAAESGWHDFVVHGLGRVGYRKDYHLRFPMPFSEAVEAAASDQELEPTFVYGVIRRESAYRVDAQSRTGARGLMQLMPATARDVAKKMGEKFQLADLYDSEINIRFGTHYLRYALDRFDQHPVLALAAYNAGPHRVSKWLPKEGRVEADWWVETIPFTETRRYVKAVMAYSTIFEWRIKSQRLDSGPQQASQLLTAEAAPMDLSRLRERMQPISAPGFETCLLETNQSC